MRTKLSDINQSVVDRFWGKVEKLGNESGCWIWIGAINSDGYGSIGMGSRNSGRWTAGAHQIAWLIQRGESHGRSILHSCDTPCCVRGDHLFLGTQQDNVLDMMSKGRVACGMKTKASKFKDEQIKEIRSLYSSGVGTRDLASKFDTTNSNISRIVNLGTWKHIPFHGSVPSASFRRSRPGARNPQAKLNDDLVREIKRIGAEGNWNQERIAQKFGVSRRAIGMILSGRTWRTTE